MLSCFHHVRLFLTLWAGLLCPWDSPGKNTGVGCHSLLQGIFLTQGWKLCLLHLLHWQASSLLQVEARHMVKYSMERFPNGSVGKESVCNAGDTEDVGSIPGSGTYPGGGNGNSSILAWKISWTEEPGGL